MNFRKAKLSRIWKVFAACGIAVSLVASLSIGLSSAQTQSSQTIGGPEEVSAQDAPLVTATTGLTTPVPFQPWNPAFIETQTKRQQSATIRRGPSADTTTGPAVPSEV